MSLESVKTLFERAGIAPASRDMPKGPDAIPGLTSIELHDMSLRHFRIALDHTARPTPQCSLWYEGHFGLQGGACAMLLTKTDLVLYKQQLYRFSHEEIAAFNIGQINNGLGVIEYLETQAAEKQAAGTVVAHAVQPSPPADIIIICKDENVPFIEQLVQVRQSGHRLML